MAIRFECPHCNSGIKAPEDSSGKQTVCPNCMKEFVIPEKKVVEVPEQQDPPPQQQSEIETEVGKPASDESDKQQTEDEGHEPNKAEDDKK